MVPTQPIGNENFSPYLNIVSYLTGEDNLKLFTFYVILMNDISS